METQHIKPLVRRNGLTLIWAGGLITSLMLLLLWLLVEGPVLPAYILLLSGMMMTLIGCSSSMNPRSASPYASNPSTITTNMAAGH